MKKQFRLFQEYQTDIYGISADTPEQSRAVIREMNLPFQLLCDIDKKVITRYHLLNPHEHGGIAYPAIFVIRPSGRIQYRSLDGTAQRVNLTEVLSFLKRIQTDDAYTPAEPPRKKVIVPLPKIAWQISRNMLLRGSLADWKHYVGYPLTATKLIWRKTIGSSRKKPNP